jgi:UPF0755 protein
MAEDWREDPFVDSDDPAARERAERRAEREAKRAERDAKRQEKEASQPPPADPPAPAEPPKPPRTPEQEFWDEDPEPAPEAEQKPEQKPQPEPEPRPEPVAAAAPVPAADPLPTPAPEPAIEQAWDKEPPSTPDDDIWGEQGDPQKAPPSGRRGDDGGSRSSSGGLGELRRHPFLIAGIILAFIVFWFVYALFQPFHSGEGDPVQVKIPKGSSVSEVGAILEDKGVIMDPIFPVSGSTFFQMRVTLAGKRSELYAGSFTLAENMSYGDAIDALSEPPAKRTVSVTVPEGYSRPQTAQLVEEVGVPGSYTKKTVKSKFLNPADYGGKGAESLEGFLFPNTFELKPKAPVADLVELQLKDFKRQIKKVDMKYAKSKNLTVFDVLIIASMIEDEAGVAKQRKLVASVIYNRLKEGMPLGIDAVTRFHTGNYTDPLTESELNEDSPYNTRENVGLPPGPINSPGLAAIQAAAHPAKTDFVYYVTAPDTCGELAFSATEAEWQRDVQAYEDAREAAGGQNPDTCEE